MKNILKPIAKSVLIPLEFKAEGSAADADIHETILESVTTILTISNEEMEDIMKKVKSLEESGLLI